MREAPRPGPSVLIADEKPRLRGVLHAWAFYLAVPLGVGLVLLAETARGRLSAAVFAGAVVTMFGASALYHRFTWAPRPRRWLRRLDHACIYGLIAGTYTPFGLLVLHGSWRVVVLSIVWGGAFVAILVKMAWVSSPTWLSALLGVALGWVGVVVFPQLVGENVAMSVLVLAGGLCYTLGALVYARRKPDPIPGVFGYHEVFHALVIVAVGLQYAAVAWIVPR